MRAVARLRPWACLALVAGALASSCSSSDVSLGETRREPPTPDPTPEPTPEPNPEPTPTPEPTPGPTPAPTPESPCDLQPETSCIPADEHCSGRILMRAGYECADGTVCCETLVGGPRPGSAGAAGAAGAGSS
jgi:hypothetical protein